MSEPESDGGIQSSQTSGNSPVPDKHTFMEQLINTGIAKLPALPSTLEQFDVTLPVKTRSGKIWQSPTIVIRPKTDTRPGNPRPLVLYYFGGGFAVGSPGMLIRPAREWAEQFNATVLLPSYRLTGEVVWPEHYEDGLGLVQTVAAGHAPDGYEAYFGANPKDGFILGGVSAGGNLAAVVTGLTSFGDDPATKLAVPLTGAFLSIPMLIRPENVPEGYKGIWKSLTENASAQGGQGLTAAGLQEVIKSFQWKGKEVESPWFSPVNYWINGNMPDGKAHPPTYFQCGQFDPLRDDAIVCEQMLSKIGVKTKLDLFPDDGHAAASVLPFHNLSKNPTIFEATMTGMEWLLQQNKT